MALEVYPFQCWLLHFRWNWQCLACVIVSVGILQVKADRAYINGSQHILQDLFKDKIYQELIRPVSAESETVTVHSGISLNKIIDVDDKLQILSANIVVHLQWRDKFNTWDPQQYNNVTHIRVPASLLWLPDLILRGNTNIEFERLYEKDSIHAILNHTGDVVLLFDRVIHTSCNLKIEFFPFDEQICYISLSSWDYIGREVDIQVYDYYDIKNTNDYAQSHYTFNSEWGLVSFQARRGEFMYPAFESPIPFVNCVLKIRRRTTLLALYIIVPIILLSITAITQFLLPCDSGEKISLSITVYLSMVIYLLILQEILPSAEEVPFLVMYIISSMVLIALSQTISIVVLEIHHGGSHSFYGRVPLWVRQIILQKLASVVCLRGRIAPDEVINKTIACQISHLSLIDEVVEDNEEGDRNFESDERVTTKESSKVYSEYSEGLYKDSGRTHSEGQNKDSGRTHSSISLRGRRAFQSKRPSLGEIMHSRPSNPSDFKLSRPSSYARLMDHLNEVSDNSMNKKSSEKITNKNKNNSKTSNYGKNTNNSDTSNYGKNKNNSDTSNYGKNTNNSDTSNYGKNKNNSNNGSKNEESRTEEKDETAETTRKLTPQPTMKTTSEVIDEPSTQSVKRSSRKITPYPMARPDFSQKEVNGSNKQNPDTNAKPSDETNSMQSYVIKDVNLQEPSGSEVAEQFVPYQRTTAPRLPHTSPLSVVFSDDSESAKSKHTNADLVPPQIIESGSTFSTGLSRSNHMTFSGQTNRHSSLGNIPESPLSKPLVVSGTLNEPSVRYKFSNVSSNPPSLPNSVNKTYDNTKTSVLNLFKKQRPQMKPSISYTRQSEQAVIKERNMTKKRQGSTVSQVINLKPAPFNRSQRTMSFALGDSNMGYKSHLSNNEPGSNSETQMESRILDDNENLSPGFYGYSQPLMFARAENLHENVTYVTRDDIRNNQDMILFKQLKLGESQHAREMSKWAEREIYCEWQQVAMVLDRVFFWIYLVLFGILLIFFLANIPAFENQIIA